MPKYEFTMGKNLTLRLNRKKHWPSPYRKSNFILKGMYWTLDFLYGKEVSFPKVKVLEILARYPYWPGKRAVYFCLSRLIFGGIVLYERGL